MNATPNTVAVVTDPELDPALESEAYVEPPELKARLDIEENQGEN